MESEGTQSFRGMVKISINHNKKEILTMGVKGKEWANDQNIKRDLYKKAQQKPQNNSPSGGAH
jgi:hypothetical protein